MAFMSAVLVVFGWLLSVFAGFIFGQDDVKKTGHIGLGLGLVSFAMIVGGYWMR